MNSIAAVLSLLVISANAANVITLTFGAGMGTQQGIVQAQPDAHCKAKYTAGNADQGVVTKYEKLVCNSATSGTNFQYAATDSTCSGTPTNGASGSAIALPFTDATSTIVYNCIMNAAGVTGTAAVNKFSVAGCSASNQCNYDAYATGYCCAYTQAVTFNGVAAQSMKYTSTGINYYSDNACATIVSSMTQPWGTGCGTTAGQHGKCADGSTESYAQVTYTPAPVTGGSSALLPSAGLLLVAMSAVWRQLW